jgi:hypothetical protein
MALTDAQLQTLKAELDSDPLGIGYAAMPDMTASEALNAIRPEQLPDHPKIRRGVVDNQEVLQRLNYQEVEALTAAQRQALNIMIVSPTIDLSADNIRVSMARWFTATGPGTTRNMLGDYQDRDASRCELIFETAGFAVSHLDVAAARAL